MITKTGPLSTRTSQVARVSSPTSWSTFTYKATSKNSLQTSRTQMATMVSPWPSSSTGKSLLLIQNSSLEELLSLNMLISKLFKELSSKCMLRDCIRIRASIHWSLRWKRKEMERRLIMTSREPPMIALILSQTPINKSLLNSLITPSRRIKNPLPQWRR